jgi:sulfate adenylyltransferase
MINPCPPAHGGACIINRTISEMERETMLASFASTNKHVYHISNADSAIFYRIGDGCLSPLEGPMNADVFHNVLDKEIIEHNGKKYAWTIPIAFPVSKDEVEKMEKGETVLVKNSAGDIIGTLDITDIYPFDKVKYNRSVFGTSRTDHPGARLLKNDRRDFLLGGKIWTFPQPKNFAFGKYMLTPNESRALFRKRGWERIVAFQTRNALHRAHEYALLYAAEVLTKKGYNTGAVLNPMLGATKSDDVPADVRMETYQALITSKEFGKGDMDEALSKSKGYSFLDNFLMMGLDMKMFFAGPKEAIMHSIYRQNYGFTNIVIGRKHADAPYDDGSPIWGDFDAHDKFDNLAGDLQIKPVKVGFAAYFEQIKRVGLVNEFQPKGYHPVFISGKKVRQKLQNREEVDSRIIRKPVADILRNFYAEQQSNPERQKSSNVTWFQTGLSRQMLEQRYKHKGAVLWLTGLSGSGKSTIASALQRKLFDRGCLVYILDGDNIRHGLNGDLGFSPGDRDENIRRIGEVAHLFADAGFIAITSFISPYCKHRDRARKLNTEGEFIETYVKASLEVCELRDPKGLYNKARKGIIKEFTGISAPYEEPETPEVIVDTEKLNPDESAGKIWHYLVTKKILF